MWKKKVILLTDGNYSGRRSDTVSVSIAHRPLSLSTRKNNLLRKELQATTKSEITHRKFGIFWKFKWYDSSNKKVDYEKVKKFYKKLKSYDTSKAEEFRKTCESGITITNKKLIEAAKNHSDTKDLALDSIILVEEGEESDESSSDESYDSSDERQFVKLDNLRSLPYRTFKFGTSVGSVKQEDILSTDGNSSSETTSVVVQPFLDKLSENGFENEWDESIKDTVSVSIALNRPLSLSTRKNNLLHKELQATTKSAIPHRKFGIFWKFKWYDSSNKEVDYEDVKMFYKKLKRYNTSKAEEFRKTCESGIAVPYQELREAAKNHSNTKNLVREAREQNDGGDVYLSILDGDTVSFNGIYSAYLRIHGASEKGPTVMSTGYEFTKEKKGDLPFVEGSKLCREIRVATAKYVKLGVYIPEPNFCVIIPPEVPTVAESFIDNRIKADGVPIKNAESVALMRNLITGRELANIEVVVSGDNPIKTAIPPRVRIMKNSKTKNEIEFSGGFKAGSEPTEKDLDLFKSMSQSHVNRTVWMDNLYINKAITFKGSKGHTDFKSCFANYVKTGSTTMEEQKLLEVISSDVLKRVKSAYDAKEKVIQSYKNDKLKVEEQALIDYISEDKINNGKTYRSTPRFGETYTTVTALCNFFDPWICV